MLYNEFIAFNISSYCETCTMHNKTKAPHTRGFLQLQTNSFTLQQVSIPAYGLGCMPVNPPHILHTD